MENRKHDAVTLLIKPSSSLCNFKCKYCFYYNVTDIREIKSYGFMNTKTMTTLIDKALDGANRVVTFAFQGGEPSLIGLEFYERFTAYVNLKNKKGLTINYTMQTNGSLITEEFADLLAEKKFLIGLSLDGTKFIHNELRLDNNKNGTYDLVESKIELFNRKGVEFNILCVVSKLVAENIVQVYQNFKRLKVKCVQFIPCLDPLGEKPFSYEYSLTPKLHYKYLITAFNMWFDDIVKNDYLSIRYFDNIFQMCKNRFAEQCGMRGLCSNQLVVEGDGTVFPCDFYCVDKYILGNINDMTIDELLNHENAIKFVQISNKVHEDCLKCDVLPICRGGCRRDRDNMISDEIGKNIYCESYHKFFKAILPKIKLLIANLKTD